MELFDECAGADVYFGFGWRWRFERCLKEWTLDPLQVGHPETLSAAGDQGGADGVLEYLVDAVVSKNRCLVIVEAELPGDGPRLVRHDQVALARRPDERTPIPEVGQVRLVPVHVAQVVLAADEQHGRAGTEAPYLGEPHEAAVAQRDGIVDAETEQHDVGAAVGEAAVLLVVAERVPQPQADANTVHHLPGTFQDILVDAVLVDGPHGGHVRGQQLCERHLFCSCC